jgi:D-serine dehydratase
MNKNYCYPTLNVLSGLQVKLEQEKAFLKNGKYGIPESVKKTFVVWKGSGIDITAAALAKMSSELDTLLSSSFSGAMKKKDSRLNKFEGAVVGVGGEWLPQEHMAVFLSNLD